MIKLNGWHRLWIVFCIAYLGIILAFVIQLWPTQNETVPTITELDTEVLVALSQAADSDASQASEHQSNVQSINFPNNQTLKFPAKLTKDETEILSAKYWKTVERETSNKRESLLLLAGMWWLIPSLMLYVMGFSIAWIIRGFKN